MATAKSSLPRPVSPIRPIPSTFPEAPEKLSRAFPDFRAYRDENERVIRSLIAAVRSGHDDTSNVITQISSSLNDGLTEVSRISTESKKAITMVTELSVNIDDVVQASVTQVLSVYATKEYAEAKSQEALQASVANTTAQINSMSSTFATQAFAEAKKQEAITAAAGNSASQVSTLAQAVATADGYLAGQYVLRVVAGAVAGMSITSSSSPSAGTTSTIDFLCNNFRITDGTTGVQPFVASGAGVKVNNLLVEGNLSGVNISRSGGLFHPSHPTVYFKSTEAVVLNGSKNWGSGNSWSFTHGTAKMMEGPGHTSYGAKHFNVHEDGVARFEIFGQIINYTGVVTIYYQKNSSGQFVAAASMNSNDGGSARIFGYYEAVVSTGDYLEWYIAPCDANGNLQAGAINQTFQFELTVLALNW